MSSRFALPNAYDPHMYREDVVTLARTTSMQNAASKNKVDGKLIDNTANPNTAMASASPASATKPSPTSPQRRNFVFADPVAFRYVIREADTDLDFSNMCQVS